MKKNKLSVKQIFCNMFNRHLWHGVGMVYEPKRNGKGWTFTSFCGNCGIKLCHNCGEIFNSELSEHNCWLRHCYYCSELFETNNKYDDHLKNNLCNRISYEKSSEYEQDLFLLLDPPGLFSSGKI